MAKNIIGNQDGPNGENDSYTIPGRGVVKRNKLVKEVQNGKHPDFSTYSYKGEEYIRANPNSSKGDNVNR